MDKRGFKDVYEMNDYIIQKQNSRVKPNDEVFILGDISLGTVKQTNDIFKKLNGKLFLISGNHDIMYLRSPDFNRRRFKWIKPYAEIIDDGRKVCLCHFPILCYNKQYRKNHRGEYDTWMVHGHVHNTDDQILLDKVRKVVEESYTTNRNGVKNQMPFNLINTFCMYSDYTPMTLDEWIEIDKKRRDSLNEGAL